MAGGADGRPGAAAGEGAFMDLRTYVTFEADVPDDASFVEDGDAADVPGGRAIAEALSALLAARGFAVSAPEQHEHFGWALTAEEGGCRTRLLIQYPGPWLLLAEDQSGIAARLLGRGGPFQRRVLEALGEALRTDGRFREVSWFTQAEFEAAVRRGGVGGR